MKKVVCILLAAILAVGMIGVCFADGEIALTPSAISEKEGIDSDSSGINVKSRGTWFGFGEVELTGFNSISLTLGGTMVGSSSGATLLVMTDDPKDGKIIGSLTISKTGEGTVLTSSIEPTTGKHKLYLRVLYAQSLDGEITIRKVTLSKDKYVNNKTEETVSDSKIKDVYADTWVAVDDMGRSVADYEEVGDVKTDTREVGMFYWNWHTYIPTSSRATVISDIVSAHPDDKENYNSSAWDTAGIYYWGEPLFGFYTSYDYWTYRKHAEMLANAGVDAIFLDYSNGGLTYVQSLNVLAEALRDAKASGVNIPRLSAMMDHVSDNEAALKRCTLGLLSIYYNCFVENDYSDIWYYYEGKPLLYGEACYDTTADYISQGGNADKEAIEGIKDFFTVRRNGGRNVASDRESGSNNFVWLEGFPQILRNVDAAGRPESVTVGVSLNHSTKNGKESVASDPYSRGRAYSEVFGEDYREIATREAYFFREQAAQALEAAPKIVLIDGWNEWTAIRKEIHAGFTNAFVDCYDDEDSRDFEPSNGALKDDCYNLLCDFVRKFKGVRKAPTASGMKTIDVNADASQWSGVGPEFLNNNQNYERDAKGLSKARELAGNTFEQWEYKTTVNNAINSAKVTFDADKLYFMVQTENDIKTGNDNWMHLFINTDRNHATGWEGYDYAVNVGGAGVISSYNGRWTKIGDAKYSVKGNTLQMEIPRSLIGVTGTVNLEFKWTDSVASDNILNFYKDGSSAPLGRFNYLFTEIEQTALSEADRAALKGTTVIKAGSNRMVVSGGKMYVYEPDTRVTPYEANGTLYIPEKAFSEIMGYGRSKTRYESADDMFLTYRYEMNDDLTAVKNFVWTNGVVGSNEISVNGKTRYLSAPVVANNGMLYIPASMLSECYGVTVKALGDGAYLIGTAANETAVNSAIGHIG